MPESPLSASPYEVLGVSASASQDDLKRAYRRALRATHPDAGGTAAAFHAVQLAWQRVGTTQNRAQYDRGRSSAATWQTSSGEAPTHVWATPAHRPPRQDSRPRARTYGHPGGWGREHFLTLIREWIGRGVPIADPYDPALVRSAPREIRHALADALAEEATARSLATLGIGYTVWHDVAVPGGQPGQKIDHVVLGPTGLFAVQSEDWGGAVTVRRGEMVGDGVDGQPLRSLAADARTLGKATGVRISVAVVVVPDDATDDSFTIVGKSQKAQLVLTRQSFIAALMRMGVPKTPRPDGNELFEVRTRLQNGIRFV
ncbi:MAG TPA: DnaJ domain-containing protein [Microbacteriaceae bacterium]